MHPHLDGVAFFDDVLDAVDLGFLAQARNVHQPVAADADIDEGAKEFDLLTVPEVSSSGEDR
jgi:hypothetical protein